MSDPYEMAIAALLNLSDLVERYVYEHAPEEAADRQREGHEAIKALRAEKAKAVSVTVEPARTA